MRESLRSLPVRVGYGAGARLMSRLRRWWVLARHPQADIRFGRDVYLGPRFSLHIPDRGSFVVGDSVEFRRDFRAEVSGHGRVSIGSGSVFTYSVLVQCTTTMEIGERCIFAQDALVLDGQHRFRDIDRPINDQGFDFHPLRIGDDAFVGAKATVMADLGQRAFVGAGAVVTRPVAPYTVAAGVPARAIDYFGPPTAGT